MQQAASLSVKFADNAPVPFTDRPDAAPRSFAFRAPLFALARIEKDRHRAVIDEGNVHVGRELAAGD
jgi:hypothetical protein